MRITSRFEIRCLKCGYVAPWGDGYRKAAYLRRLTLWRCPRCGRLRWALVRDVD